MNYKSSESKKAQKAIKLVTLLQSQLVGVLEGLDEQNKGFEPVSWLRDNGTHGGGTRYVSEGNKMYDRASVNISHVQYDDTPDKKLASATAFSAIVHPDNPHCPSAHFHFSWTEMKDGKGYWRMMADLNPSLENNQNKVRFDAELKGISGRHYDEGKEQGDRYFFIPALNVHRGVSHFYLEGFNRGNFDADYQLAEKIASTMIDTYGSIVSDMKSNFPNYTELEKQTQIDYHTFYVYQVLTLDKGTTAGILVHNQNDLGVFGSLPSTVNAKLFESWIDKTPEPFNDLVRKLSDVIPVSEPSKIEDSEKTKFAQVIREFYSQHPGLIQFKSGPISKKA